MARFIPKSIAIAIVYEAERGVKFVAIDPKRLISRLSFWAKDMSCEPRKIIIKRKFGSHTAKANIAHPAISAKRAYIGRRNTFLNAWKSIYYFPYFRHFIPV